MKDIRKECRHIVNACWTVDKIKRPSMVTVHAGFARLWADTPNAEHFFADLDTRAIHMRG